MLAPPLSFSSFPSQSAALSTPHIFFSFQSLLNCPAWFLLQFLIAFLFSNFMPLLRVIAIHSLEFFLVSLEKESLDRFYIFKASFPT